MHLFLPGYQQEMFYSFILGKDEMKKKRKPSEAHWTTIKYRYHVKCSCSQSNSSFSVTNSPALCQLTWFQRSVRSLFKKSKWSSNEKGLPTWLNYIKVLYIAWKVYEHAFSCN